MPEATAADYTSGRRLRAALNFGNPVLARRDEDGRPAGVTVDLAAELAHSLGADLEWVEFERAADVTAAAGTGAWDLCFLAVDPERSRSIAFTAPYVRISGCYLAAATTAARTASDVVEGGLRIAVVEGSAYALFLSRQPGAENLVVLPTLQLALAALDDGRVDGLAGIEQVMAREAERRPGARILQPPFMEIRQAVGLPLGRRDLLPDLQARLSGLRASGTLLEILERHGLPGDCAL
jgi:polar amino acid transport system substrate-binding protein